MKNSYKIPASDLDAMKRNLVRCELRAMHGMEVSDQVAKVVTEQAAKCGFQITLVPIPGGIDFLLLVDGID
jgi:hypothetical protein